MDQEEEEILDAQRREGADEIELENHDNVPAIDENDNDGLDPQFEPLNPGFAAEEEPMVSHEFSPLTYTGIIKNLTHLEYLIFC